MTRPRRFRPDVDDVGAAGDKFAGLRERQIERLKPPAVGKRIGRHIENAHDDRLHADELEKGVATLTDLDPRR